VTERIVVIGADAAGMSAASQAKRIAGDAVEIVAFERGSYSSYSACGIPYWVAGDVDGPERLVARSPDAHRRNGIDLRMRTEVEKIDLAAGWVLAHDLKTSSGSSDRDEPITTRMEWAQGPAYDFWRSSRNHFACSDARRSDSISRASRALRPSR